MRDPMRVENWALDYSYRVIYTFHMAFFFWLSGYVYRMTKGEPTLAAVRLFLKKKLKKQLLPWLAYSLCCYVAFAVALRIPAAASILASAGYGGGVSLPFFLLRCFQGDNIYAFHLWFIYTLFLIAALVAVAECASVRCGGTAAAARGGLFVLALLGVALVRIELLPLGGWAGLARYVCTYLPFYLLGMWMQGMHLARKWKLCWCFAGLTYIFIRASFFSGWAGDVIQAPSVPAELLLRYLSYLFAARRDAGVLQPLQTAPCRCSCVSGRTWPLVVYDLPAAPAVLLCVSGQRPVHKTRPACAGCHFDLFGGQHRASVDGGTRHGAVPGSFIKQKTPRRGRRKGFSARRGVSFFIRSVYFARLRSTLWAVDTSESASVL